jgi:hypothetical protein
LGEFEYEQLPDDDEVKRTKKESITVENDSK